jgi:putative flippase GtrA
MFLRVMKYRSILFRFFSAGVIYNLIALSVLETLLYFGVSSFWSGFVSSFFGISLSYLMNKLFVFKVETVEPLRQLYFFLYNLLIITLYSTTLMFVDDAVNFSMSLVAPLISLAFSLLNFYILKKIFGAGD